MGKDVWCNVRFLRCEVVVVSVCEVEFKREVYLCLMCVLVLVYVCVSVYVCNVCVFLCMYT